MTNDYLETALDLADQYDAIVEERDRWRSIADRLAAAVDGIGEDSCTHATESWDTCRARESQYLPWCKPCLALDALARYREVTG